MRREEACGVRRVERYEVNHVASVSETWVSEG